jgi:RND family efflux transporter MFP subunit
VRWIRSFVKNVDIYVNVVIFLIMNLSFRSVLPLVWVLGCAPTPAPQKSVDNVVQKRPTAGAVERTLPPLVLAAVTSTTDRYELSFRTGGLVHRVHVKEGASVRRGQVLAQLDKTELSSGVAQAQEAVARATRIAQRAKKLADAGAANRSDAEDSATALAVAEAQLRTATFMESRGVIVAPADGRIERRGADPGEMVASGQPVLVLAASSSSKANAVVVAKAHMPAAQLRFVGVGTQANTTIDDLAWTGSITSIGGSANALGQVEVEMQFRSDASHTREVATGEPIRVEVTSSQRALAIPALALMDAHAGLAVVAGIQADVVRLVDVEVLAFQADTAFVRAREAVERVVLPGATPLMRSQR